MREREKQIVMGMVRNKVKQFGARIKRIAGYGLKPVIEWIKDGNVRARARYAPFHRYGTGHLH